MDKHILKAIALLLSMGLIYCFNTSARPASGPASSPEAKAKHPVAKGADLRILDDNIWDYSHDTIPPKWKEIGDDPRDFVRAPQFAALIKDYRPDVFAFQEYSSHMHKEFYPLVSAEGYQITYESDPEGNWDNTPIFYNKSSVEPVKVNYTLFAPPRWSNIGSKSFTSVVFKRISDGKMFALVSTHLWWKSDSKQPGSTMARASQVRLIMAEVEIIRAEYGDIPVFVTGDMNCEENTIPIKQFTEAGYVPCYKAATVYGDNHNGHHICSPGEGWSAASRRKGPDRETGAIDHCLIYDPSGNTEVKVFDCIMEEYTLKLTDHYPNLIDVKL